MNAKERNFIGASDAPTLLGLGDQTEDDLAARILHGVERDVSPDSRARMDRGTREEPRLLAAYEAIYGVKLDRPGTIAHPRHPLIRATPDGMHARVVVECKTRNKWAQNTKDPAKKFGLGGTSDIPAQYAAQVQFQMAVLDAPKAIVWVSFGEDLDDGSWRMDWLAPYPVERDEEMGANLIFLAVDFLRRRIEGAQRGAA